MFETARGLLDETVATGDPIAVIDAKVDEAARWLDEESRAALWLYAWSLAGTTRSPQPPPAIARAPSA